MLGKFPPNNGGNVNGSDCMDGGGWKGTLTVLGLVLWLLVEGVVSREWEASDIVRAAAVMEGSSCSCCIVGGGCCC